MKDFADDNFIFDKNGRKLSKPVENTVGKGEIARYEQFLLFPQCFQKACFPGESKGVIVWEWVNVYVSLFGQAGTVKNISEMDKFTTVQRCMYLLVQKVLNIGKGLFNFFFVAELINPYQTKVSGTNLFYLTHALQNWSLINLSIN